MKTPLCAFCVAAICAAWPSLALAHAPVPGIEGFYLGLAHPIVSPPFILLLLALGILAGSFEIERIKEFLGAFFLGAVSGLLEFGGYFDLREAMLVTAIFAAVLTALAPARFHFVSLATVALGGFLLGVMTRDPGDIQPQLTVAAGTFLSINAILLFTSAGLDWVREVAPWHWVRIAFRVVAAWIAAIALLLLAFMLSAPPVAAS